MADEKVGKAAAEIIATEDSEEPVVGKKKAVSVGIDLKTTLIMAVIALISIVFAFVVMLKMFPPLEVGEFEAEVAETSSTTEDVEGASTTEDVEEAPQEDQNLEQEEKSEKINETTGETKVADAGEKNNVDNIEKIGNIENKYLVPLESIVVNLGGASTRRYLRVQINLEVGSENAGNIIEGQKPILRDKMISVLATKNPKELETEKDLSSLRMEIKGVINELLGYNDIIKQVYFSDFIIQ